jgi:glycosyltransferase involved in cell wall biosynthesis
MATHKLSVVIITRNEESNIQRCLESVRWADEIIIVDSGSTDSTLDICRQFDCTVIETVWRGFGRTKQYAVESATHEWILSVDADEEVSPELAWRIRAILEEPGDRKGFRIRRKSFYLNTMIRHSGWQHDYQLRLFNRHFGNFNDTRVHESVRINAATGTLDETLWHHPYPTISSHLRKMNDYSTLGAQVAAERGRTASLPGAFFRGTGKFLKMFVLQRGFLDGPVGFVLAVNSSFGVYIKYLKLWKKNK